MILGEFPRVLRSLAHIELLPVEIGDSVGDGFGNDVRKGLGDPVGAIADCVIREKALGDVLATGVVSGVGGDALAVGFLGGKPFGGICVGGVEGGMGKLVTFDFYDNLTLPIKDPEVFFGCPEGAFPTKRRLPR